MTSPPRQRTIADLAAPYENHLSPVVNVAPGVCPTCRSGFVGWPRCYQCGTSLPKLKPGGADAVGIIATAPAREQLAYELLAYKKTEGVSARTQLKMSQGIASVLWMWLTRHEACLAAAAGVDRFSMITTVPSSNRVREGQHPLVAVVSKHVDGSGDRYRPLLEAGDKVPERAYTPNRFRPLEELQGESVLVIDDRWVSGAQLQSAACALKLAGAGRVAALAIGRHYHPAEASNAAVEQQRKTMKWSWDRCLFDPEDSPASPGKSL